MQGCRKQIRRAISKEIFEAVNAASLNPARALGEDGEIGSLKEGKRADIIIYDEKFDINMTILGGTVRYEGGK